MICTFINMSDELAYMLKGSVPDISTSAQGSYAYANNDMRNLYKQGLNENDMLTLVPVGAKHFYESDTLFGVPVVYYRTHQILDAGHAGAKVRIIAKRDIPASDLAQILRAKLLTNAQRMC